MWCCRESWLIVAGTGGWVVPVLPARPVIRLPLGKGLESCSDGWEHAFEQWRWGPCSPGEHRHDLGLRLNLRLVGLERLVVTSSRLSVWVAAFCGLLSMAAGLAMEHLFGGLLSSISSPVLAVSASS